MVEGARRQRPVAGPRHGFTLRSLFFVSLLVAVPFLLLANLRSQSRPDDSLASPLYLAVGVVAVLISAAIGNAVGNTRGLFVLASATGLIWVMLVALCSEFSNTLRMLVPAHVAPATATVLSLAAIVRRHRDTPGDGPHPMLQRLLKVKSGLRHMHSVDDSQIRPGTPEATPQADVASGEAGDQGDATAGQSPESDASADD